MNTNYTQISQSDIASIYSYIAEARNSAASDRVIDSIVAVCESLATFPGLGRHRPEFDNHGLEVRSIVEGAYTIFYTEHTGSIFVVRVVHGARDIGPSLFEVLGVIK